jgi:hypothetical protein
MAAVEPVVGAHQGTVVMDRAYVFLPLRVYRIV